MEKRNPITRLAAYAGGMAIFPQRTTARWLQDPSRMRVGVLAWGVLSVLHGGAAFIGGLNGFGAVTPPALSVPAEDYYLWMGPLTPLIYLVVFVLLAGIIQLGSRRLGGQGTFEDTFVSVVLCFWLPIMVTMWLFEMPVFVFFPACRRTDLGGLCYLPEWLDTLRQIAGMAWILIVMTLSVKVVQKIPLWKAVVLIAAGAIPALTVMLTYIR